MEKESQMTSAYFNTNFPKPWRFVVNQTSFSLRAANGRVIGQLQLQSNHAGIPQREWNRHVAAALGEYLPVSEPQSGAQWPAAEPPPAARTA